MGQYWGARVFTVPGSGSAHIPNRYAPARQDFGYTKAPGASGADDIETINRKIMNQHPEDISLLADRWQNAHDLLVSIRSQLLLQARILEREWRQSKARALFLEKGPGMTLAYLDDWIDATDSNKEALRALVPIVEQARKRMSEIYAAYERDIAAARDISTWDEIQEELQFWQGWRLNRGSVSGMFGISRDTSEAKEQAAREAVNAVHERYNRIAQEHASKVATRYAETFTKIGDGHGALFEPMDVVFNPPHPPLPGAPGAPGVPGVPGTPPQPPSVPKQLRPVPPPGVPPMLLRPDTVTPAPPAPVPSALPAVPVPPAAGPVPGAPVLRTPTAPAALIAPAAPTAPAAPAAPAAPSPRTGPGAAPSPSRPGVHNGVLRAANPPATPPSLPPGMPKSPGTIGRKAPAAPGGPPGAPQAPGNPGRRGGTPDDGGTTPPKVRPVDTESDFSSPPSPSSPVLNNPRQHPPRTVHKAPPPTGPGRAGVPAPPADAVSPVLRARSTPPPAPPAPARTPPARSAASTVDADWTGAGAARGRASDPLLSRRATPEGQAGLKEVPDALRRRPVVRPELNRPGEAAELAPRRTISEEPALSEVPPEEEAFHVETPGGGVIGKQPEPGTRRPEPPPLLGRA